MCLACGYDLSGLSERAGACPECGASYEAWALELAGAPRTRRADVPIWRRLAWLGVIGACVVFYFACVPLAMFAWWLSLAMGCAIVGAIVLLVRTGPRDVAGVERFVFTRAGIWRALLDDAGTARRIDAHLVPYAGASDVRVKRLTHQWRRVQIGRAHSDRIAEVVFDANVRCPDADEARVVEVLRGLVGGDRPQGAPPLADPPA